MKRQLVVGDTIKARGITATIAKITFQEPWEWRQAWYIEFTDTNGVYRNWKQNCDGGKAYDKNGNEIVDNNNKEDKNMAESTMQVIEVEGAVYTSARAGYYYRKRTGEEKWTRVPKSEWEEAMQTKNGVEEWGNEEQEAKKAREAEAKKSDKQAEAKVNRRRSKDVAHESNGVTLTSKQVKFIKLMPQDDFYEHGLDSALWIDVFCDTISGEFNPMAVGAMVSTLREKGLVNVASDRVNGKKCKFFCFTDLGKQVAKELGLA